MVYSEVKNEYGFSAADIWRYREKTGAGLVEAKKHFMWLYKEKQKQEMVRLVESGSLEDIQKVVRILVDNF